ncbi:MAG: hypothetical protein [Bacteriophage sp.]|nr:MAG: hypothetical protein [Bacteriophage sp.]
MAYTRQGIVSYDDKIKLHYQIELAKRGLKKTKIAHDLDINYTMLSNALNGVENGFAWPSTIREQVDEYFENFDDFS